MIKQEFCYWLQGYFELSGSAEPLTETQLNIIKNHIALVSEVEGKNDYTAWLQGAIDVCDSKESRSKLTLLAKEKLHKIFQHVIDPSYNNNDKLNKIHNPAGYQPPLTDLIRC